jgi:hypothetical protein
MLRFYLIRVAHSRGSLLERAPARLPQIFISNANKDSRVDFDFIVIATRFFHDAFHARDFCYCARAGGGVIGDDVPTLLY